MANLEDQMSVYDASKVITTVDGKVLSGFGDADMVTAQKSEPYATVSNDAQGTSSAAINNVDNGVITINLAQTSTVSNRIMMDLVNRHKIFPISITDSSTGERVYGNKAIIDQTPQMSFNKGVTQRSYSVQVLDFHHEWK